jgi:hypothetical protein
VRTVGLVTGVSSGEGSRRRGRKRGEMSRGGGEERRGARSRKDERREGWAGGEG